MNNKDKKFLSFSSAIEEILDDFKMYNTQYNLFAKVYSFIAGGEATPGEEKCPPMGITYGGIWYQPDKSKERKFYNLHKFDDLLTRAFSSKHLSGENIVNLYTMVMGINAYIGIGPGNNEGIWVETEMEKFKCIQCGNCCLNLSDSYCTTAYEEDMIRWEEEGRRDILDYIVAKDLWISPRTGKDVTRCPWLKKGPAKEKHICRIHDTKPRHCLDYPKSKKHALQTGCKGFD